jgi:hypothetical protein
MWPQSALARGARYAHLHPSHPVAFVFDAGKEDGATPQALPHMVSGARLHMLFGARLHLKRVRNG